MAQYLSVIKKNKNWFLLTGVLLWIFLTYLPALNGQFLNWDDYDHVVNNESIRGLDAGHCHSMFTSRVNRTYVPLTSLSFAVEYHFFNLRPFFYHLDNV